MFYVISPNSFRASNAVHRFAVVGRENSLPEPITPNVIKVIDAFKELPFKKQLRFALIEKPWDSLRADEFPKVKRACIAARVFIVRTDSEEIKNKMVRSLDNLSFSYLNEEQVLFERTMQLDLFKDEKESYTFTIKIKASKRFTDVKFDRACDIITLYLSQYGDCTKKHLEGVLHRYVEEEAKRLKIEEIEIEAASEGQEGYRATYKKSKEMH